MNLIDAQKLAQLVEDQYGEDAARLVVLGRGDEYAVYIKSSAWFCWCFADFTAYRAEGKRRAEAARRERSYQHAINPAEPFALAM